MATSAFGLGRRHWSSQQCYLHCLRPVTSSLKWPGMCCMEKFCSLATELSLAVLDPPWMYFVHLCLSSVILIDSSMGSPVHVLMLSIQAVHGLLACVHLSLFLALSLSPGNSLVASWCDRSMLVSFVWIPWNLSQSFQLGTVESSSRWLLCAV